MSKRIQYPDARVVPLFASKLLVLLEFLEGHGVDMGNLLES